MPWTPGYTRQFSLFLSCKMTSYSKLPIHYSRVIIQRQLHSHIFDIFSHNWYFPRIHTFSYIRSLIPHFSRAISLLIHMVTIRCSSTFPTYSYKKPAARKYPTRYFPRQGWFSMIFKKEFTAVALRSYPRYGIHIPNPSCFWWIHPLPNNFLCCLDEEDK